MARETQRYKRTLVGSVGSGVKSIFGGSKKQYYILEHRIGSKYHQAGEQQEIIVDQAEIGRDEKCQVRFDEYFETVSRRHAAIVREGNHWKLVPLSQVNPVLLNGQKVQKEWFLQHGDEIQCAVNGPKLGFMIPSGKKKTAGSISLRRRLNLFGKQVLRPHRRTIAVLLCIILLAIAAGVGYYLYSQGKNIDPGIEVAEVEDVNDDKSNEEDAKERQADVSESKPSQSASSASTEPRPPVQPSERQKEPSIPVKIKYMEEDEKIIPNAVVYLLYYKSEKSELIEKTANTRRGNIVSFDVPLDKDGASCPFVFVFSKEEADEVKELVKTTTILAYRTPPNCKSLELFAMKGGGTRIGGCSIQMWTIGNN